MKAYTDLEQSKKLSEILPIESADMYYHYNTSVVKNYHEDIPNIIQLNNHFTFFNDDIPCWSLAALLDVLPYKERIALAINDYQGVKEAKYAIGSVENDTYDCYADNPIDACYEMIIKLHDLKLL